MVTVTRCTIIKRFTYRDDPLEEFGNTYCFKGPPPGDDASWTVLMNDVLQKEQSIYTNDVHFVRFYGYNQWADVGEDTPHHVFAHDWTIPGPPPAGGVSTVPGLLMAGDQAALLWWKMNRLSKNGKPVYLRKYVHHGYVSTSDHDELDVAYKGLLVSFVGGGGIQSIHGGLRSGRTDDTVLVSDVSPYVTTRTLKRRGKRPNPS